MIFTKEEIVDAVQNLKAIDEKIQELNDEADRLCDLYEQAASVSVIINGEPLFVPNNRLGFFGSADEKNPRSAFIEREGNRAYSLRLEYRTKSETCSCGNNWKTRKSAVKAATQWIVHGMLPKENGTGPVVEF